MGKLLWVKNQTANILSSVGQSLRSLLDSAAIMWKQTRTRNKQTGVAGLQYNFIYKTGRGQDLAFELQVADSCSEKPNEQ